MKTSQKSAVTVATIAACLVVSTTSEAKRRSSSSSSANANSDTSVTFPAMPSGWLTAFPTVVQTGTKPTLTWGINYPSIVEDYVTITAPGTITADEDVDCEIRVLGAGVTVSSSSSSSSSSYSFVPTEATMSYDNNSYQRIFYGTNHEVNPDQVINTFVLEKNKELDFGGRYYNSGWGPTYTSEGGTQNIKTLVNGMVPPSNVPPHNSPSLESFLKPYIGPNGKVWIGPMDVIVFMEVTHQDSQVSDPGYDLQDVVLLLTFKSRASTNNGHGNNIDGVDSSNTGNAPFIYLDTDPSVDDEGSGGGAAPSNP